MAFVVCGLLVFVRLLVWCVCFVERCSLCVVCLLLVVVCWCLFVVCCLLLCVRCWLLVVRWWLVVVGGCSLFAGCRLLVIAHFVVCCLLCVARVCRFSVLFVGWCVGVLPFVFCAYCVLLVVFWYVSSLCVTCLRFGDCVFGICL